MAMSEDMDFLNSKTSILMMELLVGMSKAQGDLTKKLMEEV